MAKSGNGLHSQTIPEATEESHPSEFSSPGGNEDIGLDALKYPEKERNLGGIMLTIGIEGDDHLIILLEDILEPCPEGSTFSKIEGMFQNMDSKC
jgi:hypothetical protein